MRPKKDITSECLANARFVSATGVQALTVSHQVCSAFLTNSEVHSGRSGQSQLRILGFSKAIAMQANSRILQIYSTQIYSTAMKGATARRFGGGLLPTASKGMSRPKLLVMRPKIRTQAFLVRGLYCTMRDLMLRIRPFLVLLMSRSCCNRMEGAGLHTTKSLYLPLFTGACAAVSVAHSVALSTVRKPRTTAVPPPRICKVPAARD